MKPLIRSFISIIALPAVLIAGELSWEVSTMGGYDTNPAGYRDSDAQALGWTEIDLEWEEATADGKGSYSLSYAGSAYSFAPETDWTAHQHTLGASYTTLFTRDLLMGGRASFGGNWNRPSYSAYSYRQTKLLGWMRANAGTWPVTARIEASSRTYPESAAFDYQQLTFDLSTRHQWDTRTTFSGTVAYSTRTYPTATIDDLIAGRTEGSSHQSRLSGYVSQGLTEKTGLRLSGWYVKGEGESRWRDDYWQVLDDPLAATGFGGRAQLSWLAPAGLTVRTYLGAQRVRESYITITTEHGARTDRLEEAGLTLEGILPWTVTERAISWSVALNASDVHSDDPDYAYGRASLVVGLKYAW